MNSIARSIAIVVGIPTLLAAIYFGLIASDVYVSEARFAIRSAKSSGGGGLAAILASPIASSGSQDTVVVTDYAHSQNMLGKVQERLNIKQHYSDDDVDVLARLDKEATQEELLEYFSKHIHLIRDTQSDVITLKVRAFDPATAQQLASLIIELSESLVNDMSHRIKEDALQTARSEVELAEAKVHAASAVLSSFRKDNVSLDPAEESSVLLSLVGGLESRLMQVRSQLSEKQAYMREDAPDIVMLKNRVSALSRQLTLEKGRLVGGDGGREMSGLIADYQPLALTEQLAHQHYASALNSLEIARLEAQRKKQYLVTFISPNFPDQALEPRRLYEILTVLVYSFLLYLIGGLMWSALKDHIGR